MDVLRGQWGRLAGPLGMACPYGGVPGVVLEIASTIDPCTCRVQGYPKPKRLYNINACIPDVDSTSEKQTKF